MVKVEVLAIGKELLIGKTLNSNAYWIGGRLARMGSMIRRVSTVDDDLEEISLAVTEALQRKPDFLITIGGLGPTPDDMTLKGLGRALGAKLTTSKEALNMVKEHYVQIGRRGIELTPARRKMAQLPKGATPVHNPLGTAPGVRTTRGRTVIYSLPGVPREMRAIFVNSVEKAIRRKVGKLFWMKIVMDVEDIFESTLAPMIKQALKENPAAYIKSHPKGVEKGVSKIELDIMTVSAEKTRAGAASELARLLRSRITRDGGVVRNERTTSSKSD